MLRYRAFVFFLLLPWGFPASPAIAHSGRSARLQDSPQIPAPAGITSLRDLKVDADQNGYPDRLGEFFSVEGWVTFAPYTAISGSECRAYLADATSGVRLVFPSSDPCPSFQLGDSLRAHGVLDQYNAMDYLAVSTFEVLGRGPRPEPRDHLIDALNGELHTGELVRAEGEVIWGDERVLLQDRTGSIRIYFRSAVIPGGRVDEFLLPGRTATVVGVLEQRDRSEPLTSGFRVTPRTLEDIRMHPPDRGWVLWAGLLAVAALVGVILWVRFWLARRESKRWQEHSARLAEEIREREKAEQARGLMETRLREAYKLESVGRLAGGIAHEFNNLLTVITGAVSMELDSPDLPAETLQSLKDIEAASNKAASLTDQLVDFSRQRPHDPAPTDLTDLVLSRTGILERLLGESLELRVAAASPCWAEVDEAQMDQALMSLIQNAKDVLPEGGRVFLTTGTSEVSEADALGPGSAPGVYAFLRVADTGPGIPDKVEERLFDPFFTTKDIGDGVGLGLSTVYGIVSQSGGHLTVDSSPGKGATFTLYFPLVAAPVRAGMVD